VTKKIPPPKDSHLFREMMGDVRPVKNDKVPLHSHAAPKPKPFPKRHDPVYLTDTPTDDSDGLGMIGREDALSFIATNVPKDVLAKLRQGHFRVDAEVDLHGMSAYEAKRCLQAFLDSCVKDRCRCVHIVHGKGYRSQDAYPVLKNNLNLWLRQHRDVQAFCSAAPRDGGTGAVYVLLYW
jgi:DNA-nicking Smr family endonuclease